MPPGPKSSLPTALLLVVVLLAAPVHIVAQEEMISIEVYGNVSTDDGSVVSGGTLQLSYVKLFLDENGLTQTSDDAVSVITDIDGKYSLKLNISPEWLDFELNFSVSTLDRVRYLEPSVKQLADIIKNGISSGNFNFEVNWVINSRPRWLELKEAIDRYGENSEKGRLLRIRGIPDRIMEFERDGQRGEIWFFNTDGIAIRFMGEIREKEFRFKPRPPK